MNITTYNQSCGYRIGQLENVVYLVNEDNWNINIDNGEAYVSGITQNPMSIKTYSIELSDSDELDERYKFTHSLKFSITGYANYRDFGGKYYAIVKSKDGVYWLVNPMFPCKVTYTYTLDGNSSHTDFTMATVSNHPVLKLNGFSKTTPYECDGYTNCKFDKLKLNERKYSTKTLNHVQYSNDGFKEVVFDKNSATFTEDFDGTYVSHTVQFNINFDSYKSSWHYNLLEFQDNLYSAIITTTCGKTILTGYHFGLQPSFTVTANDESTPDNIQIRMSDLHDDGDFIGYYDSSDVTVIKNNTTSYIYTTEHNGWECVDVNEAKYLLKKEIDAFGNDTGNYQCLSGYTEYFVINEHLNIVGEFSTTETFDNPSCGDASCVLRSSLPNNIVFNSANVCKSYSLKCDSDWTLSSSSPYITVSPSSGAASESYTVQVCNTLAPTSSAVTVNLLLEYCLIKTKVTTVRIEKNNDCLPVGSVYDISANGQYVTIPTQCCVDSASSSTLSDITIQTNYIKVYTPQNTSGSGRTHTLNITFCDDTTAVVYINQDVTYEQWVKEGEICDGINKCDLERKYTGTTSTDINSRTDQTRKTNCAYSMDCQNVITRWIDSVKTYCEGGAKYIVQVEQQSLDGGSNWVLTGRERLGSETSDSPAECSGATLYEKWEEDNHYFCDDTTKYSREQLYTSTDNVNWTPQYVFRMGNRVLEIDSEECGYRTPYSAWTCEKWEDDGYYCYDATKYVKQRRYVRMCNDCSNCNEAWIAQDIWRMTNTIIESQSTDCGYSTTLTGNCSKWEVFEYLPTVCIGTTKRQNLRKYVRNCPNGCDDCNSEWSATSIYKYGDIVESKCADCGYVPLVNYYDWEIDGSECDGFDLYERANYKVSEDGNKWYDTSIYALWGDPIETNSTQCGYSSTTIDYDYRWILTTKTDCVNGNKYHMYQRQRKLTTSSTWEDVVPTTLSYNAYGTETPDLVESASTDCGYYPVVDPKYRWYQAPATDYICSGTSKYYKEYYQVSYDNEATWGNVTPEQTRIGSLIEADSSDCGGGVIYYRWVNIPLNQDYYCSGTTKYYKQKKQQSTDNVNWTDVYPAEYQMGQSAQTQSTDCGYIPPSSGANEYLTLTALNTGRFGFYGNNYYVRTNGGQWVSRTAGQTVYISAGDKISFKANLTPTSSGIGYFSANTQFNVEGNPMSMLYGDNFSGQTSLSGKYRAFNGLFSGCTTLISAENMALPATTLEESCYQAMFKGCTSLTTAPQLPATSLTINCYNGMFMNCSSLTTTPILPAATLATGCYYFMFYGCSSLANVTCLATDISASYCTSSWLGSVNSSGTFIKAASMSSWTSGSNGIPMNWTVRNYS